MAKGIVPQNHLVSSSAFLRDNNLTMKKGVEAEARFSMSGLGDKTVPPLKGQHSEEPPLGKLLTTPRSALGIDFLQRFRALFALAL
ncbi:hypothetical protein FPOA_07700 [Fusarium poae]|uniref:Uncharacterized protein n=1 Tax=Fusarium poae TaxID=36050 RepID=A0A1B8ALF4_FUSPO|nr:hypothetical protein FPOA_07700 [Fusarium poae]